MTEQGFLIGLAQLALCAGRFYFHIHCRRHERRETAARRLHTFHDDGVRQHDGVNRVSFAFRSLSFGFCIRRGMASFGCGEPTLYDWFWCFDYSECYSVAAG